MVGVRQTEMHTAKPFVPQPSASGVEDAVVKLKRYKSSGFDQIPAELIQAGGETLHSEIHKLIRWSGTKKSCLTSGRSQLWWFLFTKNGGKSDCRNYRGVSLLSTSYKILSNILLSRLTPFADEIVGDHQCGF
jgi:hypothetical protein